MKYLTEKDALTRFSCYALQLEREVRKGGDAASLADDIPVPIHFNHPQTLEVQLTNTTHAEHTGYAFEHIQELGQAFLMEAVHPATLAAFPKILPTFQENKDASQIMMFVQRIKPLHGPDYLPVVTFAKSPEDGSGPIVCLSPFPWDFERLSRKMERIVDLNIFQLKNMGRFQSLTGREVQILRLLAHGHNNPAIAVELDISRATVETHRKRLKSKLELKTFRDVMRYALAFGLVDL